MKVLVIVGVIAVLALIVLLIALIMVNARLRRLINGLEDPVLWLPRKERHAHARKLVQREDDEYQQKLIDKFMSGQQEVAPGITKFDPPKGI